MVRHSTAVRRDQRSAITDNVNIPGLLGWTEVLTGATLIVRAFRTSSTTDERPHR